MVLDVFQTLMVGWASKQEDGIVSLPKLFDDGGERRNGPAFMGASTARVDGNMLVVGVQSITSYTLTFINGNNANGCNELSTAYGPYIL